jgi:hypothetical protein
MEEGLKGRRKSCCAEGIQTIGKKRSLNIEILFFNAHEG